MSYASSRLCPNRLSAAEPVQALTATMSTETADATKAQQEWSPPVEGSPCWVEIPAHDTEGLKVCSGSYSVSDFCLLW